MFIFIPGHAGFWGNERAHRLVSPATILEGQPPDQADIINNRSDIGRVEEFRKWVNIYNEAVWVGSENQCRQKLAIFQTH